MVLGPIILYKYDKEPPKIVLVIIWALTLLGFTVNPRKFYCRACRG